MHHGFERIVVPIDGSTASMKAIAKAFIIAKGLEMDVLALHVVEVPLIPKTVPGVPTYMEWENELKREGDVLLDKIVKMGEKEGVTVNKLVVVGSADEEIILRTRENDLIIMGSKGHTAIERIFLGSVSEKVLHHAMAPVLIVRH